MSEIQTFVVCSQCKHDYRTTDPTDTIIGWCKKEYPNHKLEGVTECPQWESRER